MQALGLSNDPTQGVRMPATEAEAERLIAEEEAARAAAAQQGQQGDLSGMEAGLGGQQQARAGGICSPSCWTAGGAARSLRPCCGAGWPSSRSGMRWEEGTNPGAIPFFRFQMNK